MAKALVVASIVWPLALAGGWWARAHGGPVWAAVATYVVAGHVCHQRPERSFHTDGVQWPVCGRCAGLYAAAPFGALAALLIRRRRTVPSVAWLAAAAIPTAITFVLEHGGLTAMSSIARFLAALSLGAAVAFFIVAVTQPPAADGR